jgi:hypothetical protein
MQIGVQESLTNPTVFRAFMYVFTEAAQRVSDRFGKDYTAKNFSEVMRPVFDSIKPSSITRPGNAFKTLGADISKKLKKDFVL